MYDDQITIGQQIMILQDGPSPLNGAIGIVEAIGEYDHAPYYTIRVYGATYNFRSYELRPSNHVRSRRDRYE